MFAFVAHVEGTRVAVIRHVPIIRFGGECADPIVISSGVGKCAHNNIKRLVATVGRDVGEETAQNMTAPRCSQYCKRSAA